MKAKIKMIVALLGLLTLLTIHFTRLQAETLQIPQDKLDGFAAAALSHLKALNGDVLPAAVKLQVRFKDDERRPVAFVFKDLQAALRKQGVHVKEVKDFVISVTVIPTEIKIAASIPVVYLPALDLEGTVEGGGGMRTFSLRNDKLSLAERFRRLELANKLYEEKALIEGVHVDVAKAGGFIPEGPSLRAVLVNAEKPKTHVEGSKVFSSVGGDYAVEIYPAHYETVKGALKIIPETKPYRVYKDAEGYAHVDFKSGDLFVVRLYNFDRTYESSARIMIDTLDSFEFSDNPSRQNGGVRWWIDKGSWTDIDGWDHQKGKALAFTIGKIGDLQVGSKEETERIQSIMKLKNPDHGGQICVSFRKAWVPVRGKMPKDEQAKLDEGIDKTRSAKGSEKFYFGSALPEAPDPLLDKQRAMPGKDFERYLESLPRERGMFRANIVIRYGNW